MPKFSIISICYNDAVGLAATIRSVGPQTFTDFEYIVQDGASTDETQDIVRGFREWVDIYNCEPDGGIYDAMNKAVQSATGDFTLFLNSSDIFCNERTLESLNTKIMDNDEIVHGFAIDKDSGHIHRYKPLNDFPFGMVFDHQATVVKTEILKKLPFDNSLKVAGDLDFFSRCRVANVRFRQIDLDVAIKPFDEGASTVYMDRFGERRHVLLRHFGAQHPDLELRLKEDLLDYVQSQFGSEELTENLAGKSLDEIIEKVSFLETRLAAVA